jgi:UDP-N-acetylmuramyl pentapeptide phosphotransferase/UDP-N-acetylglucosamine-1-phosphate transferase
MIQTFVEHTDFWVTIERQSALLAILCLLTCGLIVVASQRRGVLNGRSHDLAAVQAMHTRATPRIGGVGLFLAYALSVIFAPLTISDAYQKFVMATAIIFFVGLLEDSGFHVSPLKRLLACVAGSAVTIVLLGVWLPRLGVPGFDSLMAYWWVGAPITVFITAAVANGFNLIDGVNGLAGLTAISTALALAYIADQAGYTAMVHLAILLAASVFGFLLVNFPFGLIFLGDAGAYTLGFVLSWFGIAVLINVPSASPWAILLTMFWPLADTLLAIFRRMRRKQDTMAPDRLHVHQLVMRALEIHLLGRGRRSLANPLSTVILAPFVIGPVIAGALLWDQNQAAFWAVIVSLTLFFGSYLAAFPLLRRLPRKSCCST